MASNYTAIVQEFTPENPDHSLVLLKNDEPILTLQRITSEEMRRLGEAIVAASMGDFEINLEELETRVANARGYLSVFSEWMDRSDQEGALGDAKDALDNADLNLQIARYGMWVR
jgi:hypothetical protein